MDERRGLEEEEVDGGGLNDSRECDYGSEEDGFVSDEEETSLDSWAEEGEGGMISHADEGEDSEDGREGTEGANYGDTAVESESDICVDDDEDDVVEV